MTGAYRHTTRTYPHTTGAHPHTTGEYPHTTGTYPHTTGTCPHTTGTYPHTTGTYPHTTWAYPHTTGTYPHTTGAYPHTTGAYPHTPMRICPKRPAGKMSIFPHMRSMAITFICATTTLMTHIKKCINTQISIYYWECELRINICIPLHEMLQKQHFSLWWVQFAGSNARCLSQMLP